MLKTLRLVAITTSVVGLVMIGCGDDNKEGGTNLPPRNTKDGGETNPGSSGAPDSGGTDPSYDCSNRQGTVSDKPACDSCSKAKCCEWILKCDGSPSCKATMDCLAGCANDDQVCILTCGSGGGTGGVFLQELGACASTACKTECDAPSTDAGIDSPF